MKNTRASNLLNSQICEGMSQTPVRLTQYFQGSGWSATVGEVHRQGRVEVDERKPSRGFRTNGLDVAIFDDTRARGFVILKNLKI